MPLVSKSRIYKALPLCLADTIVEATTVKRTRPSNGDDVIGRTRSATGFEQMKQVPTPRVKGKPPHCGRRRKVVKTRLLERVNREQPEVGNVAPIKPIVVRGRDVPTIGAPRRECVISDAPQHVISGAPGKDYVIAGVIYDRPLRTSFLSRTYVVSPGTFAALADQPVVTTESPGQAVPSRPSTPIQPAVPKASSDVPMTLEVVSTITGEVHSDVVKPQSSVVAARHLHTSNTAVRMFLTDCNAPPSPILKPGSPSSIDDEHLEQRPSSARSDNEKRSPSVRSDIEETAILESLKINNVADDCQRAHSPVSLPAGPDSVRCHRERPPSTQVDRFNGQHHHALLSRSSCSNSTAPVAVQPRSAISLSTVDLWDSDQDETAADMGTGVFKRFLWSNNMLSAINKTPSNPKGNDPSRDLPCDTPRDQSRDRVFVRRLGCQIPSTIKSSGLLLRGSKSRSAAPSPEPLLKRPSTPEQFIKQSKPEEKYFKMSAETGQQEAGQPETGQPRPSADNPTSDSGIQSLSSKSAFKHSVQFRSRKASLVGPASRSDFDRPMPDCPRSRSSLSNVSKTFNLHTNVPDNRAKKINILSPMTSAMNKIRFNELNGNLEETVI